MKTALTPPGLERRRFVKRTAAVLAASALPASAMTLDKQFRALPAHLVYDRRLPDPGDVLSRVFRFSSRRPFDGDVTALWQGFLAPLWQEQTSLTVGYTRYAERFVLATLAREHGYRVRDLAREDGECLWQLEPVPAGMSRARFA